MHILLILYLVLVAVIFMVDRAIFQQVRRMTGQRHSPTHGLVRALVLPFTLLFLGALLLFSRLFGRQHSTPGQRFQQSGGSAANDDDGETINLTSSDYSHVKDKD